MPPFALLGKGTTSLQIVFPVVVQKRNIKKCIEEKNDRIYSTTLQQKGPWSFILFERHSAIAKRYFGGVRKDLFNLETSTRYARAPVIFSFNHIGISRSHNVELSISSGAAISIPQAPYPMLVRMFSSLL